MSQIIRAYTGYNEWMGVRYYTDFTIRDALPKGDYDYGSLREGDHRYVKAIKPAHLDCEQGCDEVYNYKYYHVIYDCEDANGTIYEDLEHIAIPYQVDEE